MDGADSNKDCLLNMLVYVSMWNMYELYDMYMLVFELMFYITTCYKLFYFIIWVWRVIYGKKKCKEK